MRLAAAVGLLAFAAADLAYRLMVGGIVTVWLPAGISLGLLLLLELRTWPAALFGLAVGNLAADALHVGQPLTVELGWAINLVEAVSAAAMVRWLVRDRRYLTSLRGVAALALGAAVLSNGATAVLGAILLSASSGTFGGDWLRWWIGDGLGMILVAPVVVSVAEVIRKRPGALRARAIVLETVAFAGTAGIVLAVVFRAPRGLDPALAILPFPLLIVSSIRHRLAAFTTLLTFALVVVSYSARGLGPLFAPALSPTERAIEVLVYLGLAALGTLIMVAVTAERSRATDSVRESEARYRALLDTARDGILTVNADLSIGLVNPSLARMVGREASSLSGKPLTTLFSAEVVDALFPEERPVPDRGAEGATEPGVEVSILQASDRETPVEVSLGKGDVGGRVFATLTVRDITARKEEERRREDLQRQLHLAQRLEAVGRLTGGVAHDYNNMLTVIEGYTEFALEEAPEGSLLAEYLGEIRAAAEHSTRLTRQLLGFARRQLIEPRTLDLRETLASMGAMVDTLVGENVTVQWEIHPDTWPVRLDPTQVQQVVMNLCANARDAITDTGVIVVETHNTVLDESYCEAHEGFVPGDFVMMAVTDDGIGMDSELLVHAFEPYFTTKAQGKGTGLGLASVYGIAKQNGGFLNLYSEPGHGTSVKLYLPRDRTGAAPEEETAPARSAETVPLDLTVLVVEDDPSILDLASRVIDGMGQSVVAALTPEEALALAEERGWRIDLLVTDVVLPKMNGRQLAERITQHNPGTRVLYTSGYTENVIARRGVLKDGVAFLEKPYTPARLREKILGILR